ncbi:MAG: tyrosine-protein phosphatase [Bacillota bacterium]
MSNYVDLHSHILHAIDDGPGTLEESVTLARAYLSAGFETVVATPHATEGRPEPNLILERLAELQEELKNLNIPLTLLPGSEYHIEPKTLDRLRLGEIITLNHSRYLLLELPFFQPLPPYTITLIKDLSAAGYIPVIPHPERTLDLQQNPHLLFDLHAAGALFQVTWAALIGRLGPAAGSLVSFMLEANLAHFFATDAHKPGIRLLQLEKPLAILADKKGEDFAVSVITDRPRRLIENQDLDLPPAIKLSASQPVHNFKTPLISRFLRCIGR